MSLTTSRERSASLSRSFDFIALLVGRESGVTLREIAECLDCTYRTAIRYANGAEVAGLVEWQRGLGGRGGPNQKGTVRLVNAKLRRAA